MEAEAVEEAASWAREVAPMAREAGRAARAATAELEAEVEHSAEKNGLVKKFKVHENNLYKQ